MRPAALFILFLGGCSLDYAALMPPSGGNPDARPDARDDDGDAGVDARDGRIDARDDGSIEDGGEDGGDVCVRGADCRDMNFCNGIERCAPEDPAANAQGCVSGTPPMCLMSQTCDDTVGRCVSNCELMPDADGDTYESVDCGGDDCNDADPAIHPGATEKCDVDDVDEDCSAATTSPQPIWYRDGDNDLYGDLSMPMAACEQPGGYVDNASDCNDGDRMVNPVAAEVCNGSSDDCDAMIDEGVATVYYADTDMDGYGDATVTTGACSMPPNYVENDDDCDDMRASSNPMGTEVCNGLDDDCSMAPDNGFACVAGTGGACTACGYGGTQPCNAMTCTYDACRGFTVADFNLDAGTAGAAGFTHECGSLCDTSTDWCYLGDGTLTGCDVISGGPGIMLPPGRYQLDVYSADNGVFDYFVYDGGVEIASALNQMNTSMGTHINVDFTMAASSGTECGTMTMRMHSHAGARIRIYSITIRRLGD